MFKDFVAAIMQKAETQLKWTTSGAYSGDWRRDIVRSRSILDQAEAACVALEEAKAANELAAEALKQKEILAQAEQTSNAITDLNKKDILAKVEQTAVALDAANKQTPPDTTNKPAEP